MRSYEEMAENILKKYNSHIERKRKIIRSAAAVGLGAAAVLGIGIFTNVMKPPKRPIPEQSGIITESSETVTTSAVTSVQATSKPSLTSEVSTAQTTETVSTQTTSKVTSAKADITSSAAGTVQTTSIRTTAMTTIHTSAAAPDTNGHHTTTASDTTSPRSETTTYQTFTTAPQPIVTTTVPHGSSDSRFMYIQIADEEQVYLKSGTDANAGQIGDMIKKADVKEVNGATDKTEKAEIYKLKGVDAKCAVIVKFSSSTTCSVYLNTAYEPETLGDMMNDMALSSQMSFGEKNVRSTSEKKYYTVSAEKIFKVLNENASAVNTKEDISAIGRDLIIFVDIPYMRYNMSFAISKQGYITTGIVDCGASFYIGEEKAQSIINYLLE